MRYDAYGLGEDGHFQEHSIFIVPVEHGGYGFEEGTVWYGVPVDNAEVPMLPVETVYHGIARLRYEESKEYREQEELSVERAVDRMERKLRRAVEDCEERLVAACGN